DNPVFGSQVFNICLSTGCNSHLLLQNQVYMKPCACCHASHLDDNGLTSGNKPPNYMLSFIRIALAMVFFTAIK
ncbi:mCG146156, partial [Mus musculus]